MVLSRGNKSRLHLARPALCRCVREVASSNAARIVHQERGVLDILGTAAHSRECVPSHIGALAVCLQPQKKTRPSFSAVNFNGTISVSLWLPSQNG